MTLYCGIDLHSNNHVISLIDEQDNRIMEKRLKNNLDLTKQALMPYLSDIFGIAVESTFNWYWLVDGLKEEGFNVQLVNTSAVKQYEGLKYSDDKYDAYWLAHLMRLGILPTGYIYPKKQRAVRDLLRKRMQLVRQRTTNILSAQNLIWRNTGKKMPSKDIKSLKQEVYKDISDCNLALAIRSNLELVELLNHQIIVIEGQVKEQVKLKKSFKLLKTVYGIGDMLALTIMLETGDISRFQTVGNYSSYCRCVGSERMSNNKKKGQGNTKNGNKYLAWAFIEAAHFANQYYKPAQKFFNRKKQQKNGIVAVKALAHKLARASYFVMRDQVPFEQSHLFK
jgi:transposase